MSQGWFVSCFRTVKISQHHKYLPRTTDFPILPQTWSTNPQPNLALSQALQFFWGPPKMLYISGVNKLLTSLFSILHLRISLMYLFFKYMIYFFLRILFLAIFTFHTFASWHDIIVGVGTDHSVMGPFRPTTPSPYSSVALNPTCADHHRACANSQLSLCKPDSDWLWSTDLSHMVEWCLL